MTEPVSPLSEPLSKIPQASLGQVLQDLEKCEDASGLFDSKKRQQKSIFVDSYAVDAYRLIKICSFFSRLKNWEYYLQVIKGKYSLDQVIDYLLPIGRAKSFVDQIRISYNILAFYPREKVVCKIYYRRKGKIYAKNEVVAIRQAEKLNLFRVPKIIVDHSNDSPISDTPVVWYEQISGKTQRAGENKSIEVFEKLLSWYDAHGVELETPARFIAPFADLTEDILVSQGWSKSEAEIILTTINKIQNCQLLLPVSWIHGDMGLSNCLVTDEGEIVIIDWEWYGKNYIFLDLYSLLSYGGNDPAFNAEIAMTNLYTKWFKDKFPEEENTMSLDLQLRLQQFIVENLQTWVGLKNTDLPLRLKNLKTHLLNQQVTEKITEEQAQELLATYQEKVIADAKKICNALSE
ncbi:phosphotransferase [Euhalothece natronophila Z-M001]|uniref:Phosphotransferase n=1 Tax=Euhalothece natronophila Z-M001 TaxID=522448 RepID=A0A5B8NR38_9CHRO|nr:phosphotransferase [Euhalothece natronophila]QDZ40749.1 phosphotransferase [Euhalothece natronophila Z-M001]